jgi:hypothetical protein
VRLRTCLWLFAAREKPPSLPRDNKLVITNLVRDYPNWPRTGKSRSPFCEWDTTRLFATAARKMLSVAKGDCHVHVG